MSCAGAVMHEVRGAVLFEFLIAFVPVFVLFLGALQLALIGAASLVVHHAAVTGVRSAAVVLDDDPAFYRNAPRGALLAAAGPSASARAKRSSHGRPSAGPRLAAIRSAVYAKLAAIAPDPRVMLALATRLVPAPSAADAIGDAGASRLAFALTIYLPSAAAVTFPIAPGARELDATAVVSASELTLRVTYLFPCLVPLAGLMMCERLRFDPVRQALSLGRAPSDARERALSELTAAEAPNAQASFAGNFATAVLQAEATLPAQTAPYRYRSQTRAEAAP